MPFTIIAGDSFTSAGVGVKINLPSSADYFKTWNITQMPLAPATPVVVMAEWFGPRFGAAQTAVNDGLRWKKSANTSVMNLDTFATSTASNGFTYVVTSPFTEAAVGSASVGSITAASPAVVTMTNTYSEGDRIRLYNTTGMRQIAGMDFTISTVSGSGFTLLGLDSSGFAAAATGVIARRISKLDPVEPEFLYVTKVSKATSMVVTVSQAHSYVVGQLVHFTIPSSFGMTELNQLTGKIIAVGTYTMTFDIDSSAFTTFAFPASSLTPAVALFATLAPAGQRAQKDPTTLVQTGYNVDYVPFHTGQFTPYMFLAGGAQSPAGATSDVIAWQAYKLEN